LDNALALNPPDVSIHQTLSTSQGKSLIDVSAIVATGNRPVPLLKALESLAGQNMHPREIIIVDASHDSGTRLLCEEGVTDLRSQIRWTSATHVGAAVQRNQGISTATEEIIWFFDDDVLFQPGCVQLLWRAMRSEATIGGVSATITNQRYKTPGLASRQMFRIMNGVAAETYAGRVIGPAVNLLPDDRDDLPEIVPVEWLNTTCTMYRSVALPSPPFPPYFHGYSLMEDLALSLEVGKKWELANARTARIFHDSQPADYKSDPRTLSCMELRNRHFIMTRVLGRRTVMDHLKLALWELFSLVSVAMRRSNWKSIPSILAGKLSGVRQIMFGKPLC
jgi:GT2 family glycosyltransferase